MLPRHAGSAAPAQGTKATGYKPFVHHGGLLLQVQPRPGQCQLHQWAVELIARPRAANNAAPQARPVVFVGELSGARELVYEELGRKVVTEATASGNRS